MKHPVYVVAEKTVGAAQPKPPLRASTPTAKAKAVVAITAEVAAPPVSRRSAGGRVPASTASAGGPAEVSCASGTRRFVPRLQQAA